MPRPFVYVSAVLLSIVAFWYLLAAPSDESPTMGSAPAATFDYQSVTGFFQQDDPNTDPESYDYSKNNFGLIDRSYETDDQSGNDPSKQSTQWQRFETYLRHLNADASPGTHYKLIIAGRHGQGFHNVAEDFYGTKAWDDYWAALDGNGTITWSDAHLTDLGKEQALEANAFWGQQLGWAGMPAPASYYVSPLYRCLQTANLTFSGLKLPKEKPFSPTVKEMLRETMGVHTCDRRSTRGYIHDAFPDWAIEPGFAKGDELWRADHRETWDEHDVRTKVLLDDVFSNDDSTVVSFTAHSGAIASLLRVIGHRTFKLPTGSLIPVFVKGVKRG